MIGFWHILKLWGAYESARAIVGYIVRAQVTEIVGSKIACKRCRFRLLSVKTAIFLRSRFRLTNQRAVACLFAGAFAIGNLDSLWLVLQKLFEERKAVIRGRRKKETVVPGAGLRNGK